MNETRINRLGAAGVGHDRWAVVVTEVTRHRAGNHGPWSHAAAKGRIQITRTAREVLHREPALDETGWRGSLLRHAADRDDGEVGSVVQGHGARAKRRGDGVHRGGGTERRCAADHHVGGHRVVAADDECPGTDVGVGQGVAESAATEGEGRACGRIEANVPRAREGAAGEEQVVAVPADQIERLPRVHAQCAHLDRVRRVRTHTIHTDEGGGLAVVHGNVVAKADDAFGGGAIAAEVQCAALQNDVPLAKRGRTGGTRGSDKPQCALIHIRHTGAADGVVVQCSARQIGGGEGQDTEAVFVDRVRPADLAAQSGHHTRIHHIDGLCGRQSRRAVEREAVDAVKTDVSAHHHRIGQGIRRSSRNQRGVRRHGQRAGSHRATAHRHARRGSGWVCIAAGPDHQSARTDRHTSCEQILPAELKKAVSGLRDARRTAGAQYRSGDVERGLQRGHGHPVRCDSGHVEGAGGAVQVQTAHIGIRQIHRATRCARIRGNGELGAARKDRGDRGTGRDASARDNRADDQPGSVRHGDDGAVSRRGGGEDDVSAANDGHRGGIR